MKYEVNGPVESVVENGFENEEFYAYLRCRYKFYAYPKPIRDLQSLSKICETAFWLNKTYFDNALIEDLEIFNKTGILPDDLMDNGILTAQAED